MNPSLAWLLVLVCAVSVGALAYVLLERRRKAEPPLPSEWLLTPRPVFSAHERRVHRQLREALPQQVVLAKLPLVRLCQPTDPSQVAYWFELLGAIHFTFAVCTPNGRVLAAIDLDDGRSPVRRSMQIKQAVLAACQIRYVRYGAEHTPSVPELQRLVPAAGTPAHPMAGVAPAMAVMPGRRRAAATVGVEVVAPRAAAAHARAWADSIQARDSMFGRDSVISGFSHSGPSVLPERGGEVVDTAPVRH
ncbi:MAG: DUF2726 domain-containing protein [Betaproteobacteria bacterium]|nr:DUF2726 domain-containing protein [Betaproteobacteria bacterium]